MHGSVATPAAVLYWCRDDAATVSPRYDVPKAAPEPLRQVQLFVNSIDLHNRVEWLPDWLSAHRLDGEDERATELREALQIEADGRLHLAGDGDALDEIVVTVLGAMLDGSWARLKACRNCRWSFYDYSPNRSATWCSMQLCGNRKKTRAYRRRRKSGATS